MLNNTDVSKSTVDKILGIAESIKLRNVMQPESGNEWRHLATNQHKSRDSSRSFFSSQRLCEVVLLSLSRSDRQTSQNGENYFICLFTYLIIISFTLFWSKIRSRLMSL